MLRPEIESAAKKADLLNKQDKMIKRSRRGRTRKAKNLGLATTSLFFSRTMKYDKDFKKTEKDLQRLYTIISTIIARNFILIPTYDVATAGTDALSRVYFNPYPYEQNLPDVGDGIGVHEAGHICFSSFATELLGLALKRGGEVLKSIVNIILDRKDDLLVVEEHPGYRKLLLGRLDYILPKSQEHISDKFEDFLYACKKHTEPVFEETRAAMHLVRAAKLGRQTTAHNLLELGCAVMNALFQHDQAEVEKLQAEMTGGNVDLQLQMMRLFPGFTPHDPNQDQVQQQIGVYVRIQQMKKMNQYAARANHLERGPTPTGVETQKLIKASKKARELVTGLLPIDDKEWDLLIQAKVKSRKKIPGTASKVTVTKIEPDQSKFNNIAALIEAEAYSLREKLRKLTEIRPITIHGLDDGDLDLSNVAGIAVGLPTFKDTVLHKLPGAAIALALDFSSSISAEQALIIKKIAVRFCIALDGLHDFTGEVWGFAGTDIYDCGPAVLGNGCVNIQVNGDTPQGEAMQEINESLSGKQQERKIGIVVCDGGPNSVELVSKALEEGKLKNIVWILILVMPESAQKYGDGIYQSLDEMYKEHNGQFGYRLLYSGFSNLDQEFGYLLERLIEGQTLTDKREAQFSGAADIN